MTIYIKMKHT